MIPAIAIGKIFSITENFAANSTVILNIESEIWNFQQSRRKFRHCIYLLTPFSSTDISFPEWIQAENWLPHPISTTFPRTSCWTDAIQSRAGRYQPFVVTWNGCTSNGRKTTFPIVLRRVLHRSTETSVPLHHPSLSVKNVERKRDVQRRHSRKMSVWIVYTYWNFC